MLGFYAEEKAGSESVNVDNTRGPPWLLLLVWEMLLLQVTMRERY